MTLTHAQTRDLLREALALLDVAPVPVAAGDWRNKRAALLTAMTDALDVATLEQALAALTPKTKRGPDRQKRKSWKPKERPLDQSSGSVPVSPPSQLGCSDPSARPNAGSLDVGPIAAVSTTTQPHFQPSPA